MSWLKARLYWRYWSKSQSWRILRKWQSPDLVWEPFCKRRRSPQYPRGQFRLVRSYFVKPRSTTSCGGWRRLYDDGVRLRASFIAYMLSIEMPQLYKMLNSMTRLVGFIFFHWLFLIGSCLLLLINCHPWLGGTVFKHMTNKCMWLIPVCCTWESTVD